MRAAQVSPHAISRLDPLYTVYDECGRVEGCTAQIQVLPHSDPTVCCLRALTPRSPDVRCVPYASYMRLHSLTAGGRVTCVAETADAYGNACARRRDPNFLAAHHCFTALHRHELYASYAPPPPLSERLASGSAFPSRAALPPLSAAPCSLVPP